MTAIYLGLYIIRPWERLFPSLQIFPFERTYAILMILMTAMVSGLRIRLNFQNVAILAYMAAVGFSSSLAPNAGAAWDAFYFTSTVAVCYFVLLCAVQSPYDLVFIVGSYVGFVGLYITKSIWEYYVNGAVQYDMGVYRLGGIDKTFSHPNSVALTVVVSLPLWYCLWRCRNVITAEWPTGHRQWLVAAMTAYPVLGIWGVFLTNSRTGMIALAVSAVLIAVQGVPIWQILRNSTVTLLLLIIVWQVLPQEQKGRIQTVWNPEAGPDTAQSSTEGRFIAFHAAMEIFGRFPMMGVGPGNFRDYRVHFVDGSDLSPHNLFAELAAETGTLGIGLFALVVAVTWVNCRRTIQMAAGSLVPTLRFLGALAHGIRGSIVLLLLEGLSLHNGNRYNWFWLAAFALLASDFAIGLGQNLEPTRDS